jgi:putative peptidoglycan lipid II flippase
VSASVAGWVEVLLLRRSLNARIGWTGLPAAYSATLWLLATLAAAVGWGVRLVIPPLHPVIVAAAILGPYGTLFVGGALWRGLPEASALLRRIRSRS